MPKPLSNDLRQRIVDAHNSGQGDQKQIAARFGVCRQTVATLLRIQKETGSIEPKPHGGGHPPAYQGESLQQLRDLVARQPDATLQELRDLTGVSCTVVAVHNTLKRLKLPLKKSRCAPKSNSAPRSSPSVNSGPKRRPK
jgi:transposase